MASLKDLSESRASLLNFDPRKLSVAPGLNGRDTTSESARAHIEWLAESIAAEGVKKPLEIFQKGESVYVADGHCRLAAVMLCIERGVEILTVPCIPESKGTSDVDRVLNQIVSNSGLRLTPIEEGANIKRALALGATMEMVAKKIGKSVAFVRQAVDFQAAPVAVHNMVRAGEVSASLAAQVVREKGDEAPEVLREAIETAKARGSEKARPRDVKASAKKEQKPEPVEAAPVVRAVPPPCFVPRDDLAAALVKITELRDGADLEMARHIAREALIEAGLRDPLAA